MHWRQWIATWVYRFFLTILPTSWIQYLFSSFSSSSSSNHSISPSNSSSSTTTASSSIKVANTAKSNRYLNYITSYIISSPRTPPPPPPPPFSIITLRKKTLVIDLDETLIHSTTRPPSINYNTTNLFADHIVHVFIDHIPYQYYVYKRPNVDFFLRKVALWYKIVIFTASIQDYADPVIDWLDDHQNIIHARFFRHNCISHNGTYLKDLAIVESDLSHVCLLDNSPASYSIQQANGIPIQGWVSGSNDQALLDLLPFLDALRFVEDVRSVLGLRLY